MNIWHLLFLIAGAGAVGGLVNALLADTTDGATPLYLPTVKAGILRPGFVGNVFVGSVAAAVSWGLYGPLAQVSLFATGATITENFTLASLAGALAVGVAGARWLSAETEKRVLSLTAATAASGGGSPALAARIAVSPPSAALRMVRAAEGEAPTGHAPPGA